MKLRITLKPKVWFAAFGVALLLALGWVATQRGPLAPINVTVTQVVTGDVSPALFGIGTVEAQRAYLIGPTAAGRVKRVLVDVGETVKAGQLLAEMEPVDLDTRVASSIASASSGRSAVAAAEAQQRDARSRQALATTEVTRSVALGRQGILSQSEVDEKLQEQKSADAQVAAAAAALSGARRDLTKLNADIGGAQQQRGNMRLSAPVDGVVTSRDAEPGSTVVAGQAVLKLIDPASLWVRTRLDQSRSAGLREGLPAQITLRSSAQGAVTGTVARLDPSSDSVTEERIAQVAFASVPAGLSTGEMAEVIVRLPTVSGALLIPNAALRQLGAHSGVWVHDDGHLRFVRVTTGAEGQDGMVQVVEGLKAGNEVVVYSQRDLAVGSRIKVVPSLVETAK